MITISELTEIIRDQQASFYKKKLIERSTGIPANPRRIVIISGVRRCGKSILIQQKLLDTALYVNFEDLRLVNFALDDFPKLELLAKEAGKNRIILDEVQNIDRWELFAQNASERGLPLFVTGSNASMLSRELGTRLTGRYSQIELFPFSYEEFCDFLIFREIKRALISISIWEDFLNFWKKMTGIILEPC